MFFPDFVLRKVRLTTQGILQLSLISFQVCEKGRGKDAFNNVKASHSVYSRVNNSVEKV